ncbi:Hypothetical predicted protein [Podarcis lilfordi]|uniref:Uncharacterized protein n=1 Tax=Podarcis lilfordi TaxID=74358 RepID=A0AA35PPA2_9SAUR|nr:Hypothetical predicted protein [Podarcis lilfordi]
MKPTRGPQYKEKGILTQSEIASSRTYTFAWRQTVNWNDQVTEKQAENGEERKAENRTYINDGAVNVLTASNGRRGARGRGEARESERERGASVERLPRLRRLGARN